MHKPCGCVTLLSVYIVKISNTRAALTSVVARLRQALFSADGVHHEQGYPSESRLRFGQALIERTCIVCLIACARGAHVVGKNARKKHTDQSLAERS